MGNHTTSTVQPTGPAIFTADGWQAAPQVDDAAERDGRDITWDEWRDREWRRYEAERMNRHDAAER